MNNRMNELTKMSLVAALYVVVSLLMAPVSFGPLNFRLAEGFNLLVLHNKRFIIGITLGVFLTNLFAYGIYDMIIGSLSTLLFLMIGRQIADFISQKIKKYVTKFQLTMIRYFILIIVFSTSMFTIAGMIVFVLQINQAFWPLYGLLFISEVIAMTIGIFWVYPLTKRINLNEDYE